MRFTCWSFPATSAVWGITITGVAEVTPGVRRDPRRRRLRQQGVSDATRPDEPAFTTHDVGVEPVHGLVDLHSESR